MRVRDSTKMKQKYSPSSCEGASSVFYTVLSLLVSLRKRLQDVSIAMRSGIYSSLVQPIAHRL